MGTKLTCYPKDGKFDVSTCLSWTPTLECGTNRCCNVDGEGKTWTSYGGSKFNTQSCSPGLKCCYNDPKDIFRGVCADTCSGIIHCGNKICESQYNEDEDSCPADCKIPPPTCESACDATYKCGVTDWGCLAARPFNLFICKTQCSITAALPGILVGILLIIILSLMGLKFGKIGAIVGLLIGIVLFFAIVLFGQFMVGLVILLVSIFVLIALWLVWK
jgi:hypothetical protein